MPMRFNHMELTFPRGTLDDVFRKEVDDFYCDVFGWTAVDTEVVGQLAHILLTGDGGDFILLAESDDPMSSPGYDHLGFLQPTRADVDELLARCRRHQEQRRPDPHQGVQGPRHRRPRRARVLREAPPPDLVRRPMHGARGEPVPIG